MKATNVSTLRTPPQNRLFFSVIAPEFFDRGANPVKSQWIPAVFVAAVLALVLTPSRVPAAQSCEALATLKLPDTTITSVKAVPAGPFTIPGPPPPPGAPLREPIMPPAFCRVEATIKPAVKFEVWLPTSDWNGNLQAVGNGGFAGPITYAALAAALKLGYATASTDTGHIGGDADWALGPPNLRSITASVRFMK
jgi:feruloyl esterase